MRITIESTDRVVEIEERGARVPARVWEGKTERGVPVAVLVTRIAAHLESDQAEFEADLKETRPPSHHAIEAFPMRLILCRYAWFLRDIQPLSEPVAAKGSLGLWEWDAPLASMAAR